MPFETRWVPPVKNESLPVLEELPAGARERETIFGPSEAVCGRTVYTRCDRCGGWVEGAAIATAEHSLSMGVLSGRSGTSYACRRCGHELEFVGMVS